MKSLPKILLLLTGGTITMVKDETGILKPASSIQEILNTFPQMKEIAQIEAQVFCNIDSSNMTPGIWEGLAKSIAHQYEDYDGFVITHGTDTLAYTASALSLALGNLHKPVVLTGSQKPITELGSDSPFNIFNSFQVAAQGQVREVAVVFDAKIIRGNRSSKRNAKKIDAFWSPQFPLLGEIGVDIKYFNIISYPKKAEEGLRLQSSFDPCIVSLNLFPGFNPQFLERIIQEEIAHGIIMRGFGPGDIPTINQDILSLIKEAKAKNIPVVIISSCASGSTYLDLYETGKKAIEAGAISAKDMTLETTTVKLMWALAQTKKCESIQEILHQNFAGEIA